jgi:hypothetical protein
MLTCAYLFGHCVFPGSVVIPFACDILMFDPKTDGKLVSKNLTIIYQGTCSSMPISKEMTHTHPCRQQHATIPPL